MMQSWTVTVAGRERHDGEAPFTYCLYADSIDAAIVNAMTYHANEHDDDDLIMTDAFLGSPHKDVPYAWNDLRYPLDGCMTPGMP